MPGQAREEAGTLRASVPGQARELLSMLGQERGVELYQSTMSHNTRGGSDN